MPANLTPQYLEAEAKFKQAKTTQEKIKALEVMMAVIPKHKGTERLRGQLKSRMAKLKGNFKKGQRSGGQNRLIRLKERDQPKSFFWAFPILANQPFSLR